MIPTGRADRAPWCTAELRLLGCDAIRVETRSGAELRHHDVTPGDRWYPIRLGAEPRDLINSAGVTVDRHGFGADRGYLEADLGQYEVPCNVDAWSGAAVLLRSAYLRDVGPLDERLFLYYEDIEHALRGRDRGWRSGYTPASVVRHAHSTTTGADSPLALRYNDRNRLLVLARHGSSGELASAVGQYLVATAAYALRDLEHRLGRRCVPELGRAVPRLRAFGGFVRMLPSVRRRVDRPSCP